MSRTSAIPADDSAHLVISRGETCTHSRNHRAQLGTETRRLSRSADPGWYRGCCRAGCMCEYPTSCPSTSNVGASTRESSLARHLGRLTMVLPCKNSDCQCCLSALPVVVDKIGGDQSYTCLHLQSVWARCSGPDTVPGPCTCCGFRRSQGPKSAKPTESVRPVSTDATASYSQGITLSKDMGYKPQEQSSIERYLIQCFD